MRRLILIDCSAAYPEYLSQVEDEIEEVLEAAEVVDYTFFVLEQTAEEEN